MHVITVGGFEHLEITSKLDLDLRIKYTEHILKDTELKNSTGPVIVWQDI